MFDAPLPTTLARMMNLEVEEDRDTIIIIIIIIIITIITNSGMEINV